ncbi:hypothetical protein DPEC_G00237140 [Dallia pectoralis]|uniref:Uncharacterized protein n=1 Tax=Dallia pectoralis TaxID=75939 RepID=A0ACC2FYD1_DALPE|nr:hypothetical protein DPEC_G00237140 [Dallia pectoralis]
MSTHNLATVFGPNILRPKAEDPETITGGAAVVQHLMSELIREHRRLFSREKGNFVIPCSSRPNTYPCHRWNGDQLKGTSQAQWHDTGSGVTDRRLCQPPQAHHSFPCSRQLSLPLIAEKQRSAQSPQKSSTLLLSYTERQQTTETLATIGPSAGALYHRNSLSQPPETADSPRHYTTFPLTASASSVMIQVDPDLSSMLPIGWLGPDDPRWTAEKGNVDTKGRRDAQDSTLSVYDNLDSVRRFAREVVDSSAGLQTGPEDAKTSLASVADTSSSWSSCEILPLDDNGTGSVQASPRRGSMRFPSFRTDLGEDDFRATSPASSSMPTDAPLSTGSSEVFLPSNLPDPQGPPANQAIYCLLAGLRQQMARQKAEFESKIQRLELRNEALHGEVVGLQSSLEQQRRWYSVAEIKIRNVERARADADRRNDTLQREMEQFFDTFGELSAETWKCDR